MNYANISTGEKVSGLPLTRILADGSVKQSGKNPIEIWAELGWREVVEVEQPAKGIKVLAMRVADNGDGKTCRMAIASAITETELQAKAEADAVIAEQQKIDWELQAKLIDADFGTWTKHERFLLAMIAKIAKDIDLAKEYESFK